jgi:hypothetical protein
VCLCCSGSQGHVRVRSVPGRVSAPLSFARQDGQDEGESHGHLAVPCVRVRNHFRKSAGNES